MLEKIDRIAILLAGGVGNRSGQAIPKQFVDLLGHPMIYYSTSVFHTACPDALIVVAMHPDHIDTIDEYGEIRPENSDFPITIVPGGSSRSSSVYNALVALMSMDDRYDFSEAKVAIHDVARPLVTPEIIKSGFAHAKSGVGSVPVVKAVSSLRLLIGKNINDSKIGAFKSEPVDRSRYVEVQTPQTFHYEDILRAYMEVSGRDAYTDDASLAEAYGVQIKLFEGDYTNIKVTNPLDFKVAELILESRQ